MDACMHERVIGYAGVRLGRAVVKDAAPVSYLREWRAAWSSAAARLCQSRRGQGRQHVVWFVLGYVLCRVAERRGHAAVQ